MKTTLKTEYHNNGQKKSEIHYKDGKEEGLWTGWFQNGQKTFEGNDKNGREDGLQTFWDKEGNVTKTETYKDDELVEQNSFQKEPI